MSNFGFQAPDDSLFDDAYIDDLGKQQHLLLTLLAVDNKELHTEAEELAGALGMFREFERFRRQHAAHK